MKRILLAGVSLAAIGLSDGAQAADAWAPANAMHGCIKGGDPYKDYSCLDAYLGTDFMSRLANYYRLEWGHDTAPADPKAPDGRRADWPTTPESTPPMPFTEWPDRGSTNPDVPPPPSPHHPLF